MSKKRTINTIFGGQMLLQNLNASVVRYILFVFFLIIIYISLHYASEKTLMDVRRLDSDLKTIRAEYTTKSSSLMNLSQQKNVSLQLKNENSDLHAPLAPPQWIPYNRTQNEKQ